MLFKKKKAHDSYENDSLRIIDENTPFAVKEAFGSFCTNILYLPISDKCKKIAVTSAMPGEGKTYISINLAITLAQNLVGKKVLLVDMDIRCPSVSKLFRKIDENLCAKTGLSEYLVGLEEEPNIVESHIPGLSVLFAGGASSNPAGLINSDKMTEFIKSLEDVYDYVIIDTPPINVVSDASLLVGRVNGYVLATRAEYSTTTALANAKASLSGVGAHVLGVVLTGYNPKAASNYGRYHKSYYNYNYNYKDEDR